MPEFEPGITQKETKTDGKKVSEKAWMMQKVRDAIIALAVENCETENHEILGVQQAALGMKLKRMMEDSAA